MKKFEIVKTTAEISWKERDEIKEGCTMWIRKKLLHSEPKRKPKRN